MAKVSKGDKIRYRRVSTRMWNDGKFLELSAPKPNARDLWIWLITGPLTTPVPGVVLTGMIGMAERLDWPLSATRRCWNEIVAQDMAQADWSRGLVWLPKAVFHNPPSSPNVVKNWRRYLDEHAPECALRTQLEAFTLGYLHGLGEPFAEAFGKGFREGCENPSANQEVQEQEVQEVQERTAPAALRPAGLTTQKTTPPKSSTWKRAIAIAHAVMDEFPNQSQDWTPEFKHRCRQQGIDYGELGGDTQRPLFARALDYVERQRSARVGKAS